MNKQAYEGIDTLLMARSYWYCILHGVFGSEPTSDLLVSISDSAFSQTLDLYSDLEGDPFSRLREVISNIDSRADVDPLKSEYTALFIGPGKLAAPPWESVYVGQENRLFQESTLAVRYAYAEFSYLPKEYKKVADDHIALMMDFMAHMARRLHDAFAQGDSETCVALISAQRTFIDSHLLNWIPAYVVALSTTDISPFYSCCADAALAFFRQDLLTLEEMQGVIAG